jgi:hypothetical protein
MLHGKVKQEQWWRFDGTEMASAVQGGKVYVSDIGEGHHHPAQPPDVRLHGRADDRHQGPFGVLGAGGERRRLPGFRVVDRAGQR